MLVSGGVSASILRRIFHALGFDEHRLFCWDLENKLIQARVFETFVFDDYLSTVGIGECLRAFGEGGVVAGARTMYPDGFVVKRTRISGSGDAGTFDLSGALSRVVSTFADRARQGSPGPSDEIWMIQERIEISEEVRVHTVEDVVVRDLTCPRYGPRSEAASAQRACDFVDSVLMRLPDALVGETMHVWDIAFAKDGRPRIVEVNLTGFHQRHWPGFQSSGFFDDLPEGPPLMASLLRYLDQTYGITIDAHSMAEELATSRPPNWERSLDYMRTLSALLNAS